MTYFQFGSITIPAVWLASIISLFLAASYSKLFLRQHAGDWYWNAFFLYFIVWKLSYIFFHFKLFLDMPLSILYFNGGTKGHFLALASLSFYLLKIAKNKHPSLSLEGANIFLLFFISYEVIINILEKNVLEASAHVIVCTSYLFLLLFFKKNNIFLSKQMFLFILFIELFLLSIFDRFLTIETSTFIWIGFTIFNLFEKER
ncbi:hypothetical protein [Bacillus alveayuensis]|uniref:hypothetical protein n=1 Tax=Aeribacillus alveayuensis TaxID=279215 RepID=UPI0005CD63BE|nr:hypothetical protein [Bacillus alveayuensis]